MTMDSGYYGVGVFKDDICIIFVRPNRESLDQTRAFLGNYCNFLDEGKLFNRGSLNGNLDGLQERVERAIRSEGNLIEVLRYIREVCYEGESKS